MPSEHSSRMELVDLVVGFYNAGYLTSLLAHPLYYRPCFAAPTSVTVRLRLT
jgi:hypothetical protein